eukprot:tig00021168_g19068.t1
MCRGLGPAPFFMRVYTLATPADSEAATPKGLGGLVEHLIPVPVPVAPEKENEHALPPLEVPPARCAPSPAPSEESLAGEHGRIPEVAAHVMPSQPCATAPETPAGAATPAESEASLNIASLAIEVQPSRKRKGEDSDRWGYYASTAATPSAASAASSPRQPEQMHEDGYPMPVPKRRTCIPDDLLDSVRARLAAAAAGQLPARARNVSPASLSRGESEFQSPWSSPLPRAAVWPCPAPSSARVSPSDRAPTPVNPFLGNPLPAARRRSYPLEPAD